MTDSLVAREEGSTLKPISLADRVMALGRDRPGLVTALLFLPGGVWIVLVVVIPLASLIYFSFWTDVPVGMVPIFTLENWRHFLFGGVYVKVLWNMAKVLFLVLLGTVLVSYPMSYYITRMIKNPLLQMLALFLCMVPFFTNSVLRALAWLPILGLHGLINQGLMALHLTREPLGGLIYSPESMVVVMVQLYSLFMVGPLTFLIMAAPENLFDAAKDLGANRIQEFRYVYFPLSLPGLTAGLIFITVMVLGEFGTPMLIGGGKVSFLGNDIIRRVGIMSWPPAAVEGVVLMVLAICCVVGLLRICDLRKQI